MEGIVVDVETGEETRVLLSPAEIADQEATRTADTAARTKETFLRTLLAAARPPAALRTKIRDGTALTAGEMQTAVRWLVLREILEDITP